ncbi:MAG: hypothetical protein ACREOO_17370 [bacterium]
MKKHQIFINRIEWLDYETKEALVHFTLGLHSYSAFSHPCTFEENEYYDVEFDFLEEEVSVEIRLTNNQQGEKKLVIRKNSLWSYDCYGQITNVNPLIVNCGDIEFELFDHVRDEKL